MEMVGICLSKGVTGLFEDDGVGFIAAFCENEFDGGAVKAPGFEVVKGVFEMAFGAGVRIERLR